MKTIMISLVALAAVAGAASASQRGYDLQDLNTVNGYSSSGIYLPAVKGGVSTLPMTVAKPAATTFDHTDEHQTSSI